MLNRNKQYTAARQASRDARHNAARVGHHPYHGHDGGHRLLSRDIVQREVEGGRRLGFEDGPYVHVHDDDCSFPLPRGHPNNRPHQFVYKGGDSELIRERRWTPLCPPYPVSNQTTPQSVSRGVDSNNSIARSNNVVESSASRPAISQEAVSMSARSLEFETHNND